MDPENELIDTGAPAPADAPDLAPAGDLPVDDAQGGEPSAPEPTTAADAVKAALAANKAAAEPAASDEPAPAKPAAPTAPTPPEDKGRADLYTLPPGVNREQRARFVALSEHAKSLEAKHTEIQQQHQQVSERMTQFENVIRDAQATPEVLSAHLSYIKACASGDLESALAFIENERRALAIHLGRPVEGVDLLADFPDLKTRVDELAISQEDALQIANARRAQTNAAQQNEHQRQAEAQRQQQEQAIAERRTALSEIDQWLNQQRAAVVDFDAYDQKIAEYLSSDVTRQILANMPPKLWKAHIEQQYAFLRAQAQTAPPRSQPTPFRPRGAGGVANSAPATARDAVTAALGIGR